MDIIGTDSSKATQKHFFFSCPDNQAETLEVIIPEVCRVVGFFYCTVCSDMFFVDFVSNCRQVMVCTLGLVLPF